MQINGDIGIAGFITKAAFTPLDEWPSTPKPGTFIFKPPRVYVCLEIADNVPVWLPISSDLQTYMHDQFVAETEWVINHTLNSNSCVVQLLNSTGEALVPDKVVQSYNQVIVTFVQPQAGRCVLITGSQEGLPRPQAAYEQTYQDLQVWVINHNLGYEPIIRAFSNNMEIQPTSIVHAENLMSTTVSFNSPKTGRVRCI